MSEQQESNSRLGDYLSHMLEAIRLARAYTEGMDKPSFLDDKRTQQAVILNLLTLGEAASHIAAVSRVLRQPPATPLEADARHAQPHCTSSPTQSQD